LRKILESGDLAHPHNEEARYDAREEVEEQKARGYTGLQIMNLTSDSELGKGVGYRQEPTAKSSP